MRTTPARRFAGPLIKGIIFVVITAVTTWILAISISNTGLRETSSYSARFSSVTQLDTGDDVRMAGVRVGSVTGMHIVDRHLAAVTFTVERDISLPSDVTATIKYRNLVGQRYIELGRLGKPAAQELEPGATIPVKRTSPALDLTDLFNGFKPLFRGLAPKQINRLSGEIIQVLQGEGGTVESLLTHIGSLTSTLANKDQVIGQVIGNLNSVLGTINANGDQLQRLISTVQGLASSLSDDRKAIGEAIDGLAAMTNSTAGLLKGMRPPLKDSIDALGELSKNLVDGKDELESFLTLLPKKFTAIGRVSSYGSWMNFFLCEAVLTSPEQPGFTLPAPRCQR